MNDELLSLIFNKYARLEKLRNLSTPPKALSPEDLSSHILAENQTANEESIERVPKISSYQHEAANELTFNITSAFSIERSSEGSPSAFHPSCSLSVLMNLLKSNPWSPAASHHFAMVAFLTSSGALLR